MVEAERCPDCGAERLSDESAGPALHIDGPARDPGLEMRSGVEALPRPGALTSPQARAVCLARFAHHELMAVELFAWALLRWPEGITLASPGRDVGPCGDPFSSWYVRWPNRFGRDRAEHGRSFGDVELFSRRLLL